MLIDIDLILVTSSYFMLLSYDPDILNTLSTILNTISKDYFTEFF
jgi:hypothetical protein